MPNGLDYKRDVLPVRALLAEKFPAAFVPKQGGAKRPLKIGIMKDLVEALPDLELRFLKAAITDYTSGPKYAACMVLDADRVDLSGQPAGKVEEHHVEYAAMRERQRLKRVNGKPRRPRREEPESNAFSPYGSGPVPITAREPETRP